MPMPELHTAPASSCLCGIFLVIAPLSTIGTSLCLASWVSKSVSQFVCVFLFFKTRIRHLPVGCAVKCKNANIITGYDFFLCLIIPRLWFQKGPPLDHLVSEPDGENGGGGEEQQGGAGGAEGQPDLEVLLYIIYYNISFYIIY